MTLFSLFRRKNFTRKTRRQGPLSRKPCLEVLEDRCCPSGFDFTTLDVPGSTFTQGQDINASGQIVGDYISIDGRHHGFLLDSGNYSTLDVPGATFTQAVGIDASGQIVGRYFDTGGGEHGFLLSDGNYTTLDVPGSNGTSAYKINVSGEIVGEYGDTSGTLHDFLLDGGSYTTIDPPGSTSTVSPGINDLGQIVGGYTDTSGTRHAFLLDGGSYTTFDPPGSTFTIAYGINNSGDIVGEDIVNGRPSSFLLSGGSYTTLNVPGSINDDAGGINDSGQIVGSYVDSGGKYHGYLATPTASEFEVSGFPTITVAGAAAFFTVTAKDSFGHTATGYRGTVMFSSSDDHAVLPVNYTFTAADQGMRTFAAALKTAGGQDLTVTDTKNDTITGSQDDILVIPAGLDHFRVEAPDTAQAGDPLTITVSARDPYDNVVQGYQGTVHFSSTDGQATLPAPYTFTPDDLGTHTFSDVTLRTAGSRTIGVRDGSTGPSGSATIAIAAAAADHLLFLQQPSNTAAGQTISPAVAVEIVDAFGNVVTDDNTDMVTLSIGNNPSGGTLSGTLTVTVSGGIARFSDLSIDLIGDGYTLVAADDDLGSAESDPFRITM